MNSYKELIELIDMNQKILDQCKKSYDDIKRYLVFNGYPEGYGNGTSYVDADNIHGGKAEIGTEKLENLIIEAAKLDNMIYLQEDILKGLRDTKNKIDEKLKGLKGLEYQVIYYKYVEGLNLQEIADKLGYSYLYIKKISSESNKRVTY